MIRRYRKQVKICGGIQSSGRIEVRNYRDANDQDHWIRIVAAAFGHRKPWTRSRFAGEFLEKVWWEPQRMWFAVDAATSELVGTVTLGEKKEPRTKDPSVQPAATIGTVHWLAVLPAYRRQGAGLLLMSHLESAAAGFGYERLELETLSSWADAIRFYEATGWQRLR